MSDYKKLDSLFVIPWESLPTIDPNFPKPGYENTNIHSIIDYVYKNLESHYLEMKNISATFQKVVRQSIHLSFALENFQRKYDKKNPNARNPDFVRFSMQIQTASVLGGHSFTQEDRNLLFKILEDQRNHPAYKDR